MLNILIIDDEADAADLAQKSIRGLGDDVQCRICTDFEKAKNLIVEYHPDIIILDLLLHRSIAEPEAPGMDIREFIWEDHFCPYIVWSAEPERHDDICSPHPFAKSVQKGKNSERVLPQEIQKMRPYIETLKEIDNYIKQQLSVAMRDVSPAILAAITVEEKQVDTIRRISRRRLAALIDEQQSSDDVPEAWEMYVCPPVSNNLRLGDIVKLAGGDSKDPNSFFTILTPSCDLVVTESQCPKVSDVLVAQCISMCDGLDKINLKGGSLGRLTNRIKGQFLSPGHLNGIIPLPKYSEKIPTMAVDVRKLQLIPIQDVGDNRKYDRIASIDSPFRELISWAYMQTACRPGIPERDHSAWAEEITGDLDSSGNV